MLIRNSNTYTDTVWVYY